MVLGLFTPELRSECSTSRSFDRHPFVDGGGGGGGGPGTEGQGIPFILPTYSLHPSNISPSRIIRERDRSSLVLQDKDNNNATNTTVLFFLDRFFSVPTGNALPPFDSPGCPCPCLVDDDGDDDDGDNDDDGGHDFVFFPPGDGHFPTGDGNFDHYAFADVKAKIYFHFYVDFLSGEACMHSSVIAFAAAANSSSLFHPGLKVVEQDFSPSPPSIVVGMARKKRGKKKKRYTRDNRVSDEDFFARSSDEEEDDNAGAVAASDQQEGDGGDSDSEFEPGDGDSDDNDDNDNNDEGVDDEAEEEGGGDDAEEEDDATVSGEDEEEPAPAPRGRGMSRSQSQSRTQSQSNRPSASQSRARGVSPSRSQSLGRSPHVASRVRGLQRYRGGAGARGRSQDMGRPRNMPMKMPKDMPKKRRGRPKSDGPTGNELEQLATVAAGDFANVADDSQQEEAEQQRIRERRDLFNTQVFNTSFRDNVPVGRDSRNHHLETREEYEYGLYVETHWENGDPNAENPQHRTGPGFRSDQRFRITHQSKKIQDRVVSESTLPDGSTHRYFTHRETGTRVVHMEEIWEIIRRFHEFHAAHLAAEPTFNASSFFSVISSASTARSSLPAALPATKRDNRSAGPRAPFRRLFPRDSGLVPVRSH